jgi:rhodanese-related sulfurtransferase
VKRVLLEALVVAAVGAIVAFGANALSPRGLRLTEDYFHGETLPVARTITNRTSAVAGETNAVAAPDPVVARLKEKGLQVVNGERAAELFHDPLYQQGAIIFIDARNDEHYQGGHIPGAYQFDNYHPENYMGTVYPICQSAQKVVIYCNGGNCEDSQFAALRLRDAQIPKEKLFVFTGGITEWTNRGNAVEIGERNSGRTRK